MESLEVFFREVLRINTSAYEVPVILLFTLGTLFWIYTYAVVIINIEKFKLVEIPIIVAPLNLAWEFCWGFLLDNDYGPIFKYASMIWFFMDCYINYKLILYGRKLVTNHFIKTYYLLIWVFLFLGGLMITYSLKMSHLDDGVGIISAYFINILITTGYIFQMTSFPEYRHKGMSYSIAWAKFLGTAPVTIGCFLHSNYKNNYFVLSMGILVFLIDGFYIYLFKNYKLPALD